MQKIKPFLWFDDNALEAAEFYVSVFGSSIITNVTRYMDGAPGEPGKVMTVDFEIEGQQFMALNGGPVFTFSSAISFFVTCQDQAEIDRLWDALLDGGEAIQCGWVKDKFGLSWQIVPAVLGDLLSDPDPDKAQRTMQAMLKMQKLDIEALASA